MDIKQLVADYKTNSRAIQKGEGTYQEKTTNIEVLREDTSKQLRDNFTVGCVLDVYGYKISYRNGSVRTSKGGKIVSRLNRVSYDSGIVSANIDHLANEFYAKNGARTLHLVLSLAELADS